MPYNRAYPFEFRVPSYLAASGRLYPVLFSRHQIVRFIRQFYFYPNQVAALNRTSNIGMTVVMNI
jgi:hypothetical protein